MADRSDAAMALAHIMTRVHEIFEQACKGKNTVWTFGQIKISPNAASIVSGEAVATLQFRDSDEAHLDKLESLVHQLLDTWFKTHVRGRQGLVDVSASAS